MRSSYLLFLGVVFALGASLPGCQLKARQSIFPCHDDDDCAPGWRCGEGAGERVCYLAVEAPDGGTPLSDGGPRDAAAANDAGLVDAGSDGGAALVDGGAPHGGGDGGPDAGIDFDDGGVPEDAGPPDAGPRDAGALPLDGGPDAGALEPPWAHPDSPFRVSLSVDNVGLGDPLAAFPALLVISDGDLDYGALDDNGEDIHFFDESGQALPHEVERWDDQGKSAIWIRLPGIPAEPDVMRLWLYFGGAPDAAADDAAAVWADYEAVYHCADAKDATGKHPEVETEGSVSIQNGFIGDGAAFGGSGDFGRLGSDVDMARATSAVTLSTWARLNSHSTPGASLVTLSIDGAGTLTSLSRANILVNDDGKITVVARALDSQDPSSNAASPAGTMPLDQWHHITGVIDFAADTIRVYLDGERVAQNNSASFPAASTPDTPSTRAIIGVDDDEDDWDLDGDLDEIRIERVARGAGWIRLQHRSMDGRLFTFGSPEARPGG